jgi:molybdate transport system substrate-binding protein
LEIWGEAAQSLRRRKLFSDFTPMMRTSMKTRTALALFGMICAASAASAAETGVYPPWQGGANDDAPNKGFEFTVPEVDNLPDFHGNPMTARLVLYVGGNYYFAMAPLVKAFEAKHPEYKGHIYYETIPPGMLVKQIEAKGTITSGNMTWTVPADAYFAGLRKIEALIKQGLLEGPAVPYVTNQLTIMVPKDNPAHIQGLADLGRKEVKLAMPNPEYERIARQIRLALEKAGGKTLADTVYEQKVKDGTTYLTHIHHRETPLWLMLGRADAGVTWKSEAVFQEQAGHPITDIPIPPEQNVTAIYAGAVVKGAPHPQAARAWLDFIRSPDALAIFEHYGFAPYKGGEKKAD